MKTGLLMLALPASGCGLFSQTDVSRTEITIEVRRTQVERDGVVEITKPVVTTGTADVQEGNIKIEMELGGRRVK